MLLAAALALALWPGRRRRRIPFAILTFVLLLANGAVALNVRYGYYSTLGDAFGVAADLEPIDALDRDTVPAEGVVVTMPIPGTTSHFPAREAYVYVPPAWFQRPKPKLPVVMLMHGVPGDPSAWATSGDAQETADAFARGHGGRAPVLVMPDLLGGDSFNDTECVDSARGNAETYLTVDVPAAVTSRLMTAPPGDQWAAAGFSLGGMCALMLSLRHPDLFHTFGDYGGLLGPRSGDDNVVGTTVADLFAGDQAAFQAHEPATLLARRSYPGTGGWFQVGADDEAPLAAARELEPLARRAGIATCLVVMPGLGHVGGVWRAGFADSLPWMAARLGLTPSSPSDTARCQATP